MVTQARLKELLDYDPGTGVFIWRVSRGTARAGSVAGTFNSEGYIRIKIDRKLYLAHRLVWLYVCGKFPVNQLDHIDRDPSNNRIENLRLATQAENKQNLSKPYTNTSGVVGVSWNKQTGKWQAYIQLNNRQIHLGLFDTIEEAAAARAAAKAKLHTFHSEDNNAKAA